MADDRARQWRWPYYGLNPSDLRHGGRGNGSPGGHKEVRRELRSAGPGEFGAVVR